MQERAKIGISSVALEGIKVEDVDKELIIFNELLANRDKIEDLIISYHYKSRGRVYNVHIEPPVLSQELAGYFNVRYAIGHFNACADMDTSEDAIMPIEISTDLSLAEINLTGEFIPEREPDEF
jgi:hypothetical protein